ncbi:MAG: fatty acid--CoA ligase [Campylobacteraceae bacterium]|jgi:fatty-acyl-CoA synthase|nr:fatty acid--CoA ligase [Campylobacteraceae bacterium]
MSDFTPALNYFNYPLLIKQLLFTPIANNPNQEIIYKNNFRMTYDTFKKRVCKLANILIELGVKKGDTVAIMDYDSHRYLECYFAIPMIGAVMHMINIRLSPEQILYTIDHAQDDVLLIHSDFIPIVEQIRGRIDTINNYILMSESNEVTQSIIPFIGEYEQLIEKASDKFDFPDFDENTRATTFYTTGTTGMPKGVYFTHRQLVLHTMGALLSLSSYANHASFNQNDVYMPITPMFHVHAWGIPYMATFMGVKQVYPGKYIPDTLLDLIQKEGVTFSHCVPTILHMLLNSPKINEIDLSKWKVIIGGASLSQALAIAGLNRGIDIFAGYGMSETCPILSLARLTKEMLTKNYEEQAKIRTKTGTSLGLVEMKIVDEDMNEVTHNGESTGEIVVRAPWLTAGYLKDQKNSENLWKDGYLHTGDVANCDEFGYFKITDRAKDIIKVGGEWVSSLELEDIIHQHPSVFEVAVIAVPDEKWGERPLGLVVSNTEDKKLLEKEIIAHAKEVIKNGLMARESMLLKIHFVNEIDKTSVGKTDKKMLREKYKNIFNQ